MPALLYGLDAWRKINKDEMNEKEKIQALKRIFNLTLSTSYVGLKMETGTWRVNQIIQCSTMVLYHNIMNSGHKQQQEKYQKSQEKFTHKSTMISKVQQVAQEVGEKFKKCEEREQL